MALPEQERFTVEDVAAIWKKSPAYVDELLRTRQFTHIIIVGELIGGLPLTRHLYFDRAHWIKDFGNKIASDRAHQDQVLEELEKAGKKIKRDREPPFEEKDRDTAYNIGPNEVANLWNPFPSQNEWKRPKDSVQVYIPRLAVEAFERKHGLQREANVHTEEKINKGSISDVSQIDPLKWYSTSHTARFLGVTQKHVQNRLIRKLRAEKTGGRWRIQGQRIREYGKEHSPDS